LALRRRAERSRPQILRKVRPPLAAVRAGTPSSRQHPGRHPKASDGSAQVSAQPGTDRRHGRCWRHERQLGIPRPLHHGWLTSSLATCCHVSVSALSRSCRAAAAAFRGRRGANGDITRHARNCSKIQACVTVNSTKKYK